MDIEKIKKSENFIEVLMDNLQTNIMVVNKDIKIESVNAFLKNMLYKDLKEVEGVKYGNAIGCYHAVEERKNCGETSFCNSCNLRKTITSTLIKKSNYSEKVLSREFYINDIKTKKYFLYSCKHIRFYNADMALLIMNDVTKLEESRRNMEKMALTDSLTGLFNRRYLFEFLANEKVQESGFSIIMGDIDHFKKINDTYGHPIGDIVLKKVSYILKSTIGEKGVIARFGGEEFIIVLPKMMSKEAYLCAEQLRTKIERLQIDKYPSGTTISLGVVQSKPGQKIDEIIKIADELLYLAKESGRNITKVK
ncbi:MAG: diguanylate cyclase [Psychrilyobacter sp.]|uniref:GGDEF domain-containing protein n=1 Tax=Psychrilyobacter sp. TaxID=2586924 RepID=UPI003C75D8AC